MSAAQVRQLTRAIEVTPDEPVNYLLRGEVRLALGQFRLAQDDFEVAQRKAAALVEGVAWGYFYRAYLDRAETGLRQCQQQSPVDSDQRQA